MCPDDPLVAMASYTISRVNPAFRDDFSSPSGSPSGSPSASPSGTPSGTPSRTPSGTPSGAAGGGRGGGAAHSCSGYESRCSSASGAEPWPDLDQDSLHSGHWRQQPVVSKAVDSVRQLSEGVSRSPTLLAVRRALEAGAAAKPGVAEAAGGGAGYLRYPAAWTEYLGSGIVPGDITLKAKGYEQVPDLTLDPAGADRLLALVEEGSRQRCCCRAATAALALLAFLAAIVGLSLALSRGQRVFGAL